MAADPNELSSGSQVFLGGLAYFVVQLCSNAWTTYRMKQSASDVKIATSSAEQVTRLETRVMGLQNQMTALNEKVSKILPDERGPGKFD